MIDRLQWRQRLPRTTITTGDRRWEARTRPPPGFSRGPAFVNLRRLKLPLPHRTLRGFRERVDSAHDAHVGNLSGLVEGDFENDSARSYALQRVGDISGQDDRGRFVAWRVLFCGLRGGKNSGRHEENNHQKDSHDLPPSKI